MSICTIESRQGTSSWDNPDFWKELEDIFAKKHLAANNDGSFERVVTTVLSTSSICTPIREAIETYRQQQCSPDEPGFTENVSIKRITARTELDSRGNRGYGFAVDCWVDTDSQRTVASHKVGFHALKNAGILQDPRQVDVIDAI